MKYLKSNKIKTVYILVMISVLISGWFYFNGVTYQRTKLKDGSAKMRTVYFFKEEFSQDWNELYGEEVYELYNEGGLSQNIEGLIKTESIHVYQSGYFYFYYPTEENYPKISGRIEYDQNAINISVSVSIILENGDTDRESYHIIRDLNGNIEIIESFALYGAEAEYSMHDSRFQEFNRELTWKKFFLFVRKNIMIM